MGIKNFKPTTTGFTRVFLIEGRARPDHKPAYQGNMMAGAISQGFGDIEKIELPSDTEFDKFVEVGIIQGAEERVSITLTGRYASNVKSELLRLAKRNCAVDVHINIGSCTNPTDYNVFTKKVVIEDGRVTNFETEDMGALGSDERANVNESIDLSGRSVYELVQVSWAERGGDIITNELLDVTRCDTPTCGDCDVESDGCQRYFAISADAGGSPGTPADVVYTLDGGANWLATDIDSLPTGNDPSAIACQGGSLVVVSEAHESLHYASLTEFDGIQNPAFTAVTAGFVAGNGPRDISVSGGRAWIVGANGYIYRSDDPASGVVVVDAAGAQTVDYNAVHALSEEFAVAVGNDGAISKTSNGNVWGAVNSPVAPGTNINTVQVKSEKVWMIGTDSGDFYYTINGGDSWVLSAFFGSGTGSVEDIYLANETVVYMSHTTAAGVGRILRSTNGGFDWVIVPEGVGTLPDNDRINAVVACAENPDIVVGVGLAADATDGYIVIGTD